GLRRRSREVQAHQQLRWLAVRMEILLPGVRAVRCAGPRAAASGARRHDGLDVQWRRRQADAQPISARDRWFLGGRHEHRSPVPLVRARGADRVSQRLQPQIGRDDCGAAGDRMIATFVPAMRTPYSIELLDQSLTDGLAAKLGKRPSIETRAVALAKVRLESGNGTACWRHNLGNVKAPASYIGNFTCITLNEVLGGKLVWFAPEGELTGSPGSGGKLKGEPIPVPDGHPQTRMVARANPTDAGYFYVDFIAGNLRYEKAFAALVAGNPEAYARELSAA